MRYLVPMREKDILRSPRMFVERWASKRKNVGTSDVDDLQLDYDEAIDVYNYATAAERASTKTPALKAKPKHLLDSALAAYVNQLPEKMKVVVRNKMSCEEQNLNYLRKWVKAVTGKINDDDLYVMAHWIWLVKRNLYSMPVVHHIMPIITSSKQGGGKSTAVKALVAPIESLMLELKVPQVVDERSFTMFTNYLVGFFDELAGADKVDISDFKRNVTSSTLTYRPMRTNTQVKISNLCSFIGASNNSVYEIIKDTTGIRRFFPIQSLELLDHSSINEINYEELWKGIDEKLPRGYYELVKEQVAQKQEDLSMKDEVQLFLDNYGIIPNSNNEFITVNGKLLYQEYVIHTKNEGIRFQVAAQTFYKKLRDMGLQATKKRDEKKVMCWYFVINANNALGGQKYDS